MEIETDSVISEEQKISAIKFGVEASDLLDVKKYMISFMKRLLLQREKVDKNLLEAHLNPVIIKLWQELLFTLEEGNRKLINI